MGESTLVEREVPLQKLRGLADQARLGRGTVALLGGEAGIGKTTLLNAFQDSMQGSFRIIRGGCDPLFTPRTFGAIHDMANALGPDVAQMLSSNTQTATLFPTILTSLQETRRPTILICEDVHWADNATLDLLKFIGRRIQFIPCLMILSFRSDEINASHPLTQVIGDLPSSPTRRIELERLSLPGIGKLAESSAYRAEDLYQITAGNPFFVTELLAAYDGSETRLPASITDAVASRLSHLSQNERQFLDQICVIPGTISPSMQNALFTADQERLAKSCVDQNVLIEDENGNLRFRHELARLATLSRQSAQGQKKRHAEIMQVLMKMEDAATLDQIVHHAAGALDGKSVLKYAPKAAKMAAASGAHREAVSHYAAALKFIDIASPETAAQLYEDWAYEAGLSLHIDDSVLEARRHAVILWRAQGRMDKVAENLRWLSRLHWYRGEAADADRYLEQAIAVLEDMPPSIQRAMAYSLRSQLCMLNDKMEASIEWGNRALELEQDFKDVSVRIHALNNIGTSKVFRGDQAGVDLLLESLELSLANDLHEDAARVYTNLGEYGVVFREFDLAERILTEGVAFDIEHDLDSWTHYLQGRLALLRMKQGRLRDAEAIAKGVLGIQRLTLLMRLPALQVLAKTQMRLGNEGAPALIQQSLNDALATGELQHIVPARLTLIEAAWLDDNSRDAIEQIEQLLALDNSERHAWDLGEVAIWSHRFQRNMRHDLGDGMPRPYKLELAGDIFAAADAWEQLGSPYSSAVALMQTLGPQQEQAFKRALKILSKLEAKAAIKKLDKIAKSAGIDLKIPKSRRGPYKASRNHPLGLTAREQEILRLMVSGSTNREISETLSRSQRTVEHHVSSILAKLNAKNRMAAMLRIQDEPWLLPKEV
ncbi:MAG: AAA family ATPase [Hyphomonadaceae bacterium]|nr:AAA family ATPase [Hyphomonadaceae bacterium]